MGRCAIFNDTGLGKTFMQVEWARLMSAGGRALIVAPLAVSRQTVREAAKLDVPVRYVRGQEQVNGEGIFITNYEMVSSFDPSGFVAVVLDESSILKALDGKTRKRLTEMFTGTAYRLCCSATPAPNDFAEIGNHAEFLGIMTRADMLASFFVHRESGWSLKGHAEEAFYRWIASWGMLLRRPSELGYSDEGFVLPSLSVEPVWAGEVTPKPGFLLPNVSGIGGRIRARRETLAARVEAAVRLVEAESEKQWLLWCGLNEEGRLLRAAIPDSVLIEGSQGADEKEKSLLEFMEAKRRVLITKPRISGFGLNLQNCSRMAFVGLSDSWESFYQCIRRSWRFGQLKPVRAFVILSKAESPVLANVMAKEEAANRMREKVVRVVASYERDELRGRQRKAPLALRFCGDVSEGKYRLLHGDCVERLREVGDGSVGLSVFSPPFLSLYSYTPSERDLGNSRCDDDFYVHFAFVVRELLRVTAPGRNCCVHVSQVPTTMVKHGVIGLSDFRGGIIRVFTKEGWIQHGEVCIDKDPQAQAIRTHAKGLLFAQLKRDSVWLRPGLADYVLVFRKPGENAVKVEPQITNDEWVRWARPVWYGVRETETLSAADGKEHADEKHICPLQLGVIARCVKLWSNVGETVLSPFMGIGSEGYVATALGRRFVGIELKRSYFEAAMRNLRRLAGAKKQPTIFDIGP